MIPRLILRSAFAMFTQRLSDCSKSLLSAQKTTLHLTKPTQPTKRDRMMGSVSFVGCVTGLVMCLSGGSLD